MEFLLVTAMVVGVVEFLRRLQQKDYFAAITIIAAAGVGALSGYLGVEGIDVPTGIVVGLAGSGLVTVASRTGAAVTRK